MHKFSEIPANVREELLKTDGFPADTEIVLGFSSQAESEDRQRQFLPCMNAPKTVRLSYGSENRFIQGFGIGTVELADTCTIHNEFIIFSDGSDISFLEIEAAIRAMGAFIARRDDIHPDVEKHAREASWSLHENFFNNVRKRIAEIDQKLKR